ncbi:MAG: hypothetical protein COU07_00160 [Candidatus Harrisonbacteria bacterium CG10_big_fil_rev_8_21_14_0_10_40_38]|uniref:Uncharacterized protein n=1 Tax=Candidatus Harrisonbacteria bacterium CG10_big_fil_rev_8_21_14_0_10_40_38 TaxID=1974583 RepID=A0A2H0USE1_9BACT|nr:MAG: hypothetical protein COU07_00160 [Candidatus Harrisonbacteria bacterium CG10_big_fil_rev_8_21_14_0_10_40_38]
MSLSIANKAFLKVSVFIEVSIVLAAFFGYEISQILQTPSVSHLILLAVSTLLWISFLCLHVYFVDEYQAVALSVGFQVFVIWLFLGNKFSLLTFVSVLVIAGFMASAIFRGKLVRENSLRIKFIKVASPVAATIMTGFAFFIAIYFVGTLNVRDLIIPKNVFEYTVKSVEKIASAQIPGFDIQAPFIDAVRSYVRVQAPEGVPESAIEKASQELIHNLELKTGAKINPSDRFVDALYGITLAKIVQLPDNYRVLGLAIIGLLLFLTIKSVAFLITWLAVLTGFGIYKFLIALNVISVKVEATNREIVIIN